MTMPLTQTPLANLGTLFTGEIVHLTAPTKADHPTFRVWRQDAEYLRQLDSGPAVLHATEDYEKEADPEHRNPWQSEEYTFAIRTLADDKLIGIGGIEGGNSNHQNAWVWIGIGDAAYRGKGYGTDAMRLLVGYAFRELNMYRITLGVFSYNVRAIRAYEKVGFRHEVTNRAALYRDGQRYDMIGMGLLRPEWDAIQAERTK